VKRSESRKQEAGGKSLGISHWSLFIGHCSFVIFPLLLLWRPLFAGEAFFWGTPLLQFVPWQRIAAGMWRAGHLPLWNPLAGCGAPLAANYQTAAFYPLNVLYLLLPAEVALSWTTALHLALAGWGMYRWGRAVGLERFPAFIGALALEGSGFLVARAALFPSIAFTFPWLAVWLWRAEVLVQRGRMRDALWLGLALGLGLLAGHAQIATYGGVLLVGYLAFRTLQEAGSREQEAGGRGQEAGGRKQEAGVHVSRITFHVSRFTFHVSRFWSLATVHCSLFIVSLVIGLGLAAVQLLPTAELMAQSQRFGGVDYDFAMTYSLWPWRLITFAAPDFFGSPGRGDYWGYATYWEDAGYMGVLPLLLAVGAVFGRRRGSRGIGEQRNRGAGEQGSGGVRKRGSKEAGKQEGETGLVRFWTIGGAIALVLALGKNTPVFPFLFRHVPGFNLFQAPARWLAVTTVALAALAALGAQRWSAGRPGRRRGALGVVVGVAVLIGGLAALRLVPGLPSTFGLATVRLGGTLVVAGALALLRRDTNWWRAVVAAFVMLDLLLFGWPLVPTVDRSLYRDGTKAAAFLQGEPGSARVYWPADPTHLNREYDTEQRVKFGYLTFDDFGPHSVGHWWEMREALLPNVGMLDGVASANNFDPLMVGRYAAFLEAAVEAPSLLRVMGVTHVANSELRIANGEPPIVEFYRLTGAPGRAWVVPAARQVSPDEMLAALAAPTFDPTAEVLLEGTGNEEQGAESTIQHPASSIQYRVTLQDAPNRVTIRATLDGPGYLVLADTWYPGWRATVDGEPTEVLRANYAFRAVWLEAGEHVVEFVYRPRAAMAGMVLSVGSVVCWLVGGLASWLSKRVE